MCPLNVRGERERGRESSHCRRVLVGHQGVEIEKIDFIMGSEEVTTTEIHCAITLEVRKISSQYIHKHVHTRLPQL